MFRRGYLALIAASLWWMAGAGRCRAQETTVSPAMQAWRGTMSRTPLPKNGCFHASYPSTAWLEVQCVSAPPPELPVKGPRHNTVGGGNDFVAQSSGLIIWGVGSFGSVTGVTSETDNTFGANAFGLQLNSNDFSSSACDGTPGCFGWEQFVFSNFPGGQYFSGVYIQYWLVYASSCPPMWTSFGGGPGEAPGCYTNSQLSSVSPITIGELGGLTLFGQAYGGTDVVILFTPSGEAAAEGQDSLLNLENYWNTTEFNVFGAGSGSQADFNSGSTIVVQNSIYDGTVNAPSCWQEGFTAESNNLSLMQECLPFYGETQYDGLAPTIVFMESNAGPSAVPSVITESPSSLTGSSAVFNGTVNPNGSETLVWFEYGTSNELDCNSVTTLALPTNFNVGSGSNAVGFSFGIGGLNPGTSYYVVACALYSGGLVPGNVVNFATAVAPTLNAPYASAVTSSTATLNDSVNPNGSDTDVWFQYSTGTLGCSIPTLTPEQDVGAGIAYVPYSANISGLSSNTTYNFVACASNAGGEVAYGGRFTTASPVPAPTVMTLLATSVSSSTATLGGTVNPNGTDTHGWFQYSTISSALDCISSPLTPQQDLGSGTSTALFNASITGLNTNTTYYFVACASNAGGQVEGTPANFTTGTVSTVINSPVPGTTLSDSLADISWSPVSGATGYLLSAGTTLGGTNVFSGTTTGTSQVVSSIPCGNTVSGTIYVQLSAEIGEQWNTVANATYTCKIGLGSFNGDSYQDLVWMNNSTDQVTVHYFGGSEGATDTGWNWLNEGGEPSGWVLAGAGDFDGNGVPDLVWEYMPTGQVTVNYYGGAGGASYLGWSWLNEAGAPGWTVVAVADMNNDGVPDLIWQNNATNQVTVNYYGGLGGAVYQGWNWLNEGGEPKGWRVVGAGDFDGNGTPDLVWQYGPTRQVTVNYYGGVGGATYQGWNWLNEAGVPGWTVVGAADFNGDGVPDLVWQNNATAQVTVNYYGGSGGATYTGWNWLEPAGFPGWTAVVPR